MKTSVLLAILLTPVMVMTFVGCATAPEGDDEAPNYPTPNRADNAARVQDAHMNFLRN